MWKRNTLVLGATVIAIFALSSLAQSLDPFRHIDVQPELSLAIVAIVFALIDAGAFLMFGGGFWTRTILATLAPAIACPIWS